jgi:cytochrome-b5 reductase
MSSYLTSLQPSPQTLVSFKHIPVNVKIQYPFGRPKFIGLIAGGTGITPIIQALHALLDPTPDPSDKSTEQICLLYGSRTKDDIIADELINSWANLSFHNPKALHCTFSVVHVLSNESQEVVESLGDSRSTSVQYCTGHIERELIESSFPGPDQDVLILICGPPPMYQALCGPRDEKDVTGILGSMGYQPHQVYKF